MKERPILFSGPMVKAILDGRKTQTRRVVKSEKLDTRFSPTGEVCTITHESHPMNGDFGALICNGDFADVIKCPYGQPGDRLWVRETFAKNDVLPICDRPDGEFIYRADNRYTATWKPSIHMPRWASRITLEITGIRVERLQEISHEDAKAEGVYYNNNPSAVELPGGNTPVEAFKTFWESINGPGSWDSNPWVWVVEFKRI